MKPYQTETITAGGKTIEYPKSASVSEGRANVAVEAVTILINLTPEDVTAALRNYASGKLKQLPATHFVNITVCQLDSGQVHTLSEPSATVEFIIPKETMNQQSGGTFR